MTGDAAGGGACRLVIARYRESLDWLGEVPPDIAITIYNKGAPLADAAILRRADAVTDLPNHGREAGSYLHHIVEHYDDIAGRLIFCQGDPFEHSPGFLDLLRARQGWSAVQPLSVAWRTSDDIPPRSLLEHARCDPGIAATIRRERYSLHTWCPIAFIDDGAIRAGRLYRGQHRLAAPESIAWHFLRRCGLERLASAAREAEVGAFCYGAIFAAEARLVAGIAQEHWRRMRDLAVGDEAVAYILERLWLHILGEPFLRIVSAEVPRRSPMA